jgi:murein L,D-transpeptidase YafK
MRWCEPIASVWDLILSATKYARETGALPKETSISSQRMIRAFYLSLGISYPNGLAAERGLRDHLINKTQYDAIMRALREKRGPPQNTLLGGDIYIHGRGAGSDWTRGCVALEDEDVRELFNAVTVGTPVTIEP